MNMFKPTNAKTPAEYLAAIDEPRRSDVVALHDLIVKTVPQLKPFILVGMIGYGQYRYKSPSGREGDWSVLALASQKNYISLYVMCVEDGKYLAESYKEKLPKASIGKSCIRFKKLADVDLAVIKELLQKAAQIGPMHPSA